MQPDLAAELGVALQVESVTSLFIPELHESASSSRDERKEDKDGG